LPAIRRPYPKPSSTPASILTPICPKWSQSIAVGSKNFVEDIKEKLGIRAKGREVAGSKDLYYLREAQAAYNSNFTPENGVLSAKNIYFWNVNS
jgi:putative transposase